MKRPVAMDKNASPKANPQTSPEAPFTTFIQLDGRSSVPSQFRTPGTFTIIRLQSPAGIPDRITKLSPVPALLVSISLKSLPSSRYQVWTADKLIPTSMVHPFRSNVIDFDSQPRCWAGSAFDYVHYSVPRKGIYLLDAQDGDEHNVPEARGVPPWEANPYGLVSLWEIVKLVSPSQFIYQILVHNVASHSPLDDDVAKHLLTVNKELSLKHLLRDRKVCVDLGLIATTATMDRIINLISQSDATWGQYHALGMELQGRLLDELCGQLFFFLTPSEAECYGNPTKDWEEIIKRWPKTQIDIEESSRCFALSRYGASVFHVLLVAEFGVIQIAKLFDVAGDRPGWGALGRLEKILGSDSRYKHLESDPGLLAEILVVFPPSALALANGFVVLHELDCADVLHHREALLTENIGISTYKCAVRLMLAPVGS